MAVYAFQGVRKKYLWTVKQSPKRMFDCLIAWLLKYCGRVSYSSILTFTHCSLYYLFSAVFAASAQVFTESLLRGSFLRHHSYRVYTFASVLSSPLGLLRHICRDHVPGGAVAL